MKFLTFDPDASAEKVRARLPYKTEDYLETVIKVEEDRLEHFRRYPIEEGETYSFHVCCDQDDTVYTDVEFWPNMHFTIDGTMYVSNGYFAIDALQAQQDLIDILKGLLKAKRNQTYTISF